MALHKTLPRKKIGSHGFWKQCLSLCLIFTLIFSFADPAFAAKKKKYRKKAATQVSSITNNPRFAAFVVDMDTGTVLHSENGDAIRHPASLTKMMTLYMTFEALQQGRLRLNQELPISAHAASMPQTNLALRKGKTITVDEAMRALVIRSANDAAVVLGEALGGSEWQFAVAMTNKAHRLGMNNTVFKNANGLPNDRQITTARDMATLGIALQRDFPRYYPYFALKDFTYNGRRYHTHNHVLEQYPGVDGIKTGYINASGYNLVSSVKRNGYRLVATVMGGRTGASRDAYMRDLLTRSLRQLAQSRPPVRGGKFYANTKAQPAIPAEAIKQATPAQVATAPATVASTAIQTPTFSRQRLQINSGGGRNDIMTGGWGIQVGAFAASQDAFMAAVNARDLAAKVLKEASINVNDPASNTATDRVYRARIENLTESQARRACKMLTAKKEPCFVYQGSGNNG